MLSGAESTIFTTVSAAAGILAGAFVGFDTWRRRKHHQKARRQVRTETIDVDAPPNRGVDSGLLVADAGSEGTPKPLAVAIAAKDPSEVADRFGSSVVLALGREQPPPDSEGSSLLHFEDTDESTGLLLPVFTQPDVLRQALKEHPDWQGQAVLEFNGAEILSGRKDDVGVVIDPWSELEFVLPAKQAKLTDAEENQNPPDALGEEGHL